MHKRDVLELRRRLAAATTDNAAEVWHFIEGRLRGLSEVITVGEDRTNELIDRLLSMVATRVFGVATTVADETYYVHPRHRIWQCVITVRDCSTWFVFDEVSGRGLAGIPRPGVDPDTWFVPFGIDDLVSERRALA